MPKLIAIGSSTGTIMRMAEIPSMNMPTKMRSRFISIRNTIGLSVAWCSADAIKSGMFCEAISHENTLAVAIIIMIAAETDAARRIIAGMSARLTSL